jgi:hypothetical protein
MSNNSRARPPEHRGGAILRPRVPTIVYGGEIQWQWEEDAYLLGVTHVLNKPVRGKLLNTLLARNFP